METVFPGLSEMQNIHPIFVHFPIAFLLGALVMELLALLRKEQFHETATQLFYMGTVMALVTVVTGRWAMEEVAHADPRGHEAPGHQFIHLHGGWMTLVTALSVFLSVYLFWMNRKGKRGGFRIGFLAGLAVLSILLTLGADRGARLVYGLGTGVSSKVLKELPHEHDEEGEHHHHD